MKKVFYTCCLGLLSIHVSANSNDTINHPVNYTSDAMPQSMISVPRSFTSQVVADNLGGARHLAITKEGIVYVKLSKLLNGKGIIMLKDSDNDGSLDQQHAFGDYTGTGIYTKGNYLYASSNKDIYRYTLDGSGIVTNPDQPEKIVSGLIDRRTHNSKSIVLDDQGNLYVNIGAYSNACQLVDRTQGSPGMKPCSILDSAGGIWQFKADKLNQTYKDGIRYATGLRNVVGLDWDASVNKLFVMQHGRDQLFQLYPEYYTARQSAELPAETLYALNKGDDAGWPYIYYDQVQKKKILAPEYGGDGKKTAGENTIDPLVVFPGHMAPNGLLFYKGSQFPAKYKNGAFIAFHGSWNRAPEKQKGYFVAFVPFINGKPSGNWEIFADNFSSKTDITSPGDAEHRPCGLAMGPDGSLYVSDDVKGTIYKINYNTK